MSGHKRQDGSGPDDISQDALPEVAPAIARSVDAGLLSGAVTLVWKGGDIVHHAAVGSADMATGAPFRRDTLFRIASMTKPIVSLAALILVEEGRIGLDDPIDRWIPELADLSVLRDAAGPVEDVEPCARPITLDDMLTHRAGLGAFFTCTGPIAAAYANGFRSPPTEPMTPDEWLAALAKLPLVWQPGARFQYGCATDVLGFLIARIEGRPLGEVLRSRITGPLGMDDTLFWVPPDRHDRIARLYRPDENGVLVDLTPPMPPAPYGLESGAGGLLSTADDYLRFGRMLLRRGTLDGVRIAAPETIALLGSNRLTDVQRRYPSFALPDYWRGQGFGLGCSTVIDRAMAPVGHGNEGSFGWDGAFGTWFTVDPSRDIVALYLSQDFLSLNAITIADIFREGRPARAPYFAFQRAVDRLA